MKIVAIGKLLPGAPEEKIYALLKEEAARAYELYTTDVFRELYFRTDQPGAVIMLECADVAAARKIIAALPMVKAGLTAFDLIPLGPFKSFESLFAK